jgi:hypothetical protein
MKWTNEGCECREWQNIEFKDGIVSISGAAMGCWVCDTMIESIIKGTNNELD